MNCLAIYFVKMLRPQMNYQKNWILFGKLSSRLHFSIVFQTSKSRHLIKNLKGSMGSKDSSHSSNSQTWISNISMNCIQTPLIESGQHVQRCHNLQLLNFLFPLSPLLYDSHRWYKDKTLWKSYTTFPSKLLLWVYNLVAAVLVITLKKTKNE